MLGRKKTSDEEKVVADGENQALFESDLKENLRKARIRILDDIDTIITELSGEIKGE